MWALPFRMCSMWQPAANCSRPARAERTGGVTLLKNRVTGVVDLGGVAPLAAAEAQPAWNEIRETVG